MNILWHQKWTPANSIHKNSKVCREKRKKNEFSVVEERVQNGKPFMQYNRRLGSFPDVQLTLAILISASSKSICDALRIIKKDFQEVSKRNERQKIHKKLIQVQNDAMPSKRVYFHYSIK